jgi:hypothetical protein
VYFYINFLYQLDKCKHAPTLGNHRPVLYTLTHSVIVSALRKSADTSVLHGGSIHDEFHDKVVGHVLQVFQDFDASINEIGLVVMDIP